MRFGGPLFDSCPDPDAWVSALRRERYTAAYCPVGAEAPDEVVRAYSQAAEKAGVVIAEVGAWSNPLSPDAEERRQALAKCREALALADRIGARCCVNIAGSRGPKWDGPDPQDLTDETFQLIVESVRSIIDAVKPTRTFYTLETMQWMYPDSAESYARLARAIARDRFAVHFDPTNLICSPQRYFATGAVIREFCGALGPRIRSCHAKDIAMAPRPTVHLDEVRPGLGALDYAVLLTELSRLDPDLPLMMEHLPNRDEYALAAGHIRSVARTVGLDVP